MNKNAKTFTQYGTDANSEPNSNMPDYDAILSLVDKVLYKYRYHYLYDDLRSATILQIALGRIRSDRLSVIAAFVKGQLRKEMTYSAIDIDLIDEAEHPLEPGNRVETIIINDACESLLTKLQLAIVDMLVDGYSVDDIVKILQLSRRQINREFSIIKNMCSNFSF